MSPTMRAKIERNIEYHTAMRDYHKEEAEKRAEPPKGEAPPRSRQPQPVQSSDAKLAEMHGDVVKQLRDVLDAAPIMSAIDRAMAQPQRPLRNLGRPTPTAGTLH
jgi:hypothetical protein